MYLTEVVPKKKRLKDDIIDEDRLSEIGDDTEDKLSELCPAKEEYLSA